MGTALDAIQRVLAESNEPLHYREIAKRAIARGYWKTDGRTPEATVNAQVVVHIKKHGPNARFRKVGPGTYALANSPEGLALPPARGLLPKRAQAQEVGETRSTMSFTDAAEKVLQQSGTRDPIHYRDIITKALELGLVATSGRTPEATLYASVLEEIQRYQKRGEQPRFQMHGRGMIGLTRWMPSGIPGQINEHNKQVRQALHTRLRDMEPGDFEDLIGRLLGEIGFDEVAVTGRSGDGGIDVRGTLVSGDVIRTRLAVQVKRWKNNVQAPVIQQVRGSLGAHEQGLIITTSGFSRGARAEALRPDAVPVGLMDGDQLMRLLVEHGIGVSKTSLDLLNLQVQRPSEAETESN